MENKDLNKNNIYNSIATFINILFPLITFPYVTRVLGVAGIGKYNFSNAIISYFNLIATLGISSYAVRECAKLKENRKELSSLASEIYSIDIYSTIIAYILLFVALFISAKLKNYTTYILVLSISFIANTIGTSWICNAVDDFKYLSFRTTANQMASLLGIFLFVKSEGDLIKYILIIVSVNFIANMQTIFYRKKYVDVSFKIFPNIKRHLKKIILLFSQNISMLLYTNADMVMLGYFGNDEIVGLYALAVKIYNVINGVIASVIGVATPGLSYDYAHSDFTSFNKKITYVVNYILFLFIPAFIGINLLAPDIIKLVSGNAFTLSVGALRILTISMLFSLISAVLGLGILFPMGYDRVNFNSCIVSAVSN
ncbi:MAG: flippase, partial [Lachnospiraceae bacterium]|nr:flippase [Lachnospiraceae bacterium]